MPKQPPVCPDYYRAGRIDRWRRVVGYRQADRRGGGPAAETHYRIPAAVPAMRGRRVAFLSDIHYQPTAARRRVVADAVARIAAFAPDYLLCGGDLAGYAADLPALPGLLRELAPLAPVRLAVPGNWESGKWWLPDRRWRRWYTDTGFHWLHNELFDDGVLAVFGTGEPANGTVAEPVWPAGERQRILLSHNADGVLLLEHAGGALALCGHSHGGQVRLPLVGALAAASIYGRKLDYGFYRHDGGDGTLLISSGLGSLSFPFRWNCRPEAVLLAFV